MSTNAIIPISNLDISKVTIGELRPNKSGGKSVPIRYNGQSLQFRIPKMTYYTGINVKETNGAITYSLSVTLKGCDPYAKERAPASAGELGNLYNFVNDLQELVLNTAAAKSSQWFGKKIDKESLKTVSMKQSINPSADKVAGEWIPNGKYPPSLRLKVPVYNGEVSMDTADQYGKTVELTVDNIKEKIPKRSEISLMVAPSIYISGNGFGITWRISYARICPPNKLTAADVFADEIEQEQDQDDGYDIPTNIPERLESVPVPTFNEQEDQPNTPPAETPVILTPPPAPAKGNRRRAVPAV